MAARPCRPTSSGESPGSGAAEVLYGNYRIQYCNVDFDDRSGGRQARAGLLNGMETSWLPDPSIPLTDVFREYTSSLARLLALPSGTP